MNSVEERIRLSNNEAQRKYKTTPKGILTQRKYYNSQAKKAENKRYKDKNKLKNRAHGILNRALKRGIIVKQNCLICDLTNSEAHHDNYNDPLNVKWYCHYHHSQYHLGVIIG